MEMPNTTHRAGRAFLELELISHKELADMVAWHERMGEERGARLAERNWQQRCNNAFHAGKQIGRDETSGFAFMGFCVGILVGVLLNVIL